MADARDHRVADTPPRSLCATRRMISSQALRRHLMPRAACVSGQWRAGFRRSAIDPRPTGGAWIVSRISDASGRTCCLFTPPALPVGSQSYTRGVCRMAPP
jgi:hypothetical protein